MSNTIAMVTLKDIAQKAGVNVSVVSRALNPTPDRNAVVAPETRAKILDIASALGYRRNRIAEFLKKGQAATIGVFLPETPNRLVADLMFGISKAAARQGFPLNFFFGETQDEFMAFMQDSADAVHSGIITYPFEPSLEDNIGKTIHDYRQKGGHVLVIGAARNYPGIPVIRMDEKLGGRLAAQHLIEKKCDRFIYESTFMPQRGQAFAQTINEHHHSPHSFTWEQAQTALKPHLNASSKRVGLFIPADFLATQLYQYLADVGRTIGKDLLLIGYDDQYLAQHLSPSLTTLYQSFETLGSRAIEKLIRMIYGKNEKNEIIAPRLIERQTTQG